MHTVAHWIAGSIKRKGALTRKAKAAGMTPMEFAEKHRHDKGLTGEQSREAITLRTIAHGRKKH